MKICVIGAGLIGTSTAYMLGRVGHAVTVLEKGADLVPETGRANGAQLSYSHVEPFASPAALKDLPTYLLGRDPAIRFGLSLDPNYWLWGLQFLKNCTSAAFEKNLKKRAALAGESARLFDLINEDVSGALKPTGRGKIVLASTGEKFAAMVDNAKKKQKAGLNIEAVTKERITEIEPALNGWTDPIAGGVYASDDTALDTMLFAQVLKDASEARFGTRWVFNAGVTGFERTDGSVTGVKTQHDVYDADVVIICTGGQINALLKPLGEKVPVWPMQGYSLTLPAKRGAPVCSVTDLKNKVVFASLGDRVRIAGFMDANRAPHKARARQEELLALSKRLWPDIADYDAEPHFWTHYRPMTPSGVPVLRESRVKGLYINACHGSLGYTFALGSAGRMVDLIGGDNAAGTTAERERRYA